MIPEVAGSLTGARFSSNKPPVHRGQPDAKLRGRFRPANSAFRAAVGHQPLVDLAEAHRRWPRLE